jgi:hypothetical protein
LVCKKNNITLKNTKHLNYQKTKNLMEEKEGVITDAAGHKLSENGGGQNLDFVNPASVIIKNGDGVVYVEITTPNKVIRVIKEVKM